MKHLLLMLFLLCVPAFARKHEPLTLRQAADLEQILKLRLQKLGLEGTLNFSLTSNGKLRADPVVTTDGSDRFRNSLSNNRIWKHDLPGFCKDGMDCYRLRVNKQSIHVKKLAEVSGSYYYTMHVDPSYCGRDNIPRSVRHLATVVQHWVSGKDTNYHKMWEKIQKQQQALTFNPR